MYIATMSNQNWSLIIGGRKKDMSIQEAICSVCVLVVAGFLFIVCITAKAASRWARKEEILEEERKTKGKKRALQ